MNDWLIDLASERFGGSVLETSDESFGRAERLLGREDPIELDHFDGWETQRRREPGHEWVIVRLGLPGIVRRVLIDSTRTTGSHPTAMSLESIELPGEPHIVELIRRPERWTTVVPRTPIEPEEVLVLPVEGEHPATHLRLVAYPDGAVARLRVQGAPLPSAGVVAGRELDLAAVVNGGLAIDCSDAHFGSPTEMLLDDRHRTGPGWLTRRRRDGRHDWAVVRLAGRGELDRLVVDTRGLEGHAPTACSVEGVSSATAGNLRATAWETVLERTPLRPDHRHEFSELRSRGPFSHLRLSVFPDGGIRRFSAFGTAAAGWYEPPSEDGAPGTR